MGILDHLGAIDAELDRRERRERHALLFRLGGSPAAGPTAGDGADAFSMVPWSPDAPWAAPPDPDLDGTAGDPDDDGPGSHDPDLPA
jgi:hypothetical protein